MLYLAEAINIIKLGKIDSWEAMIQKILFGSLFSIGIVTNSIIIYKIIKSKLGDFKPVHVYQINFFSGLTMIKISGILLTFFTDEKGTVSVLCHILMFFSSASYISRSSSSMASLSMNVNVLYVLFKYYTVETPLGTHIT